MARRPFPVRFLLVLSALLLLLPCLASAEPAELKPLSEPYKLKDLRSACICGNVKSYNAKKRLLTLEVVTVEFFSAKGVKSLKVGDYVHTQGRKIKVCSIETDDEDGMCWINAHAEDPEGDDIWFIPYGKDKYWISVFEEPVWRTVGTVKITLPEDFVFLDYLDPAAGDNVYLETPSLYPAKKFVNMLKGKTLPNDPGLDCHLLWFYFDCGGNLISVCRRYSW